MKYPLSLLTILGFFFLFSALKEDQDKVAHYTYKPNSFQQITDSTLVDLFYSLNHNQFIWVGEDYKLNHVGDSLLNFIGKARYFGLEPEFYDYSSLKKLSNRLKTFKTSDQKKELASSLEKLLTLNYFRIGKDLNYGRIDSIEDFTKLSRKSFEIDLPNYFYRAVIKDSIIGSLLQLQPEHIEYKKLQKAVSHYLDHTKLSEDQIKVESYRSDSLQTAGQTRKALLLHQYIENESVTDSIYLKALKKFQYDHGLHPDGIIGKYTAKALSKSTMDYYRDAAVSLERWRWKISWGKDFLYVNIPSFQLKYYLGNTLQDVYKVVVGKRSRKTPEVYSKLKYLVAYPYWHVPKSISVNEILVKAKKDPQYLSRNHYEVFTKNLKPVQPEQVNWDTINYQNFNFYIRQKGGASNALGLVKFIFKNKYSIYLHDTPTKYHFKREIRAYSHGCIRVQDALELADRILKFDKNIYDKDSIESFVKRRIEKKIPLNKELRVYIHYITCDTDAEGNLIFYNDVYNKDEKLKKKFFSDGS